MWLIIMLFVSLNYANPVQHGEWDVLVKKHVSKNGMVDYQGFLKDKKQLQVYLDKLSANRPTSKWSKNEKMAFWINAYNAFTVKLILDNYPIKSIKDIKRGIPFVNSVWDIAFIPMGKEKIDLNYIEHTILRKEFKDPRIHAAINCASFSCPLLRNEAYYASRLDEQLNDAMRKFVNDSQRNQLDKSNIKISKIFSWFAGDFKLNGSSVVDYLNKYAKKRVQSNAKIDFLEYQWELNDVVK
ncbi:MAG: DUF547 domain-containing protein [Saprospiraceae bacterium]|nr:DUF547 domain-containing protein [Saprospiraceae bacterium]MDP4913725.1 DUF547 domain-containing protein [Saprospiraceae bacterium]MDP5048802.1 DUF547 domain-containing protein [Saprospiraceae bacterium]